MPFLTEELWQRLATDRATRPVSIALAPYPQYRQELTDFAAEREIGILQEIVTMARTLRTETKLDPKQQLEGALYSRTAALEVAQRHAEAIQKLANVKLEFKAEAAPKAAAMRSTAEFDLVLRRARSAGRGAAQAHGKGERAARRRTSPTSSASWPTRRFSASAPAHVVDSIRQKLADYEAQLEKLELPMTLKSSASRSKKTSAPAISPRAPAFPKTAARAARFLAREPLVLAGLEVLAEIYRSRRACCKRDGDRCQPTAKSSPTVDGHARTSARTRARGAQFPAAPERRRHAGAPVRRCRRRHRLPRARYAQDHARPARPRKSAPPPPAASPTIAWACSTPS